MIKINRIPILLLCFVSTICFCQTKHSIQAEKTKSKITIDGKLDDVAWENAARINENFITIRPTQGLSQSQRTDIKLLYSDESLFISAFMKENSRDSIMTELVSRDNIGNTDYLILIIDTYKNGTNGFEFIIQSTGVQFDARLTPNNEDNSWDAVWYSATTVTDSGWIAELEIPYSAIRFPQSENQAWNINFIRRRQALGEQASWYPIDLNIGNAWLTQMGKIENLADIQPPVRLSFSPYISSYVTNTKNRPENAQNSTSYSYNLGLDLKYGLSDAFTLDMTLVPDFGQTRSDDQVLNLGPVELWFQENRSFFTEGVELFNKGGLFYSRRVGDGQQLYNATKISGRTAKGMGIGFFNAVEAEESIDTYDDQLQKEMKTVTNPLTNYNVIVLDQDLANNSSITLTNTSVLRRGQEFRNSNVSGLNLNIKNKKQSYRFLSTSALSILNNKQAENTGGHYVDASIDKISGDFTWGAFYEETSPNHNPNDLGFLRFVNYRQLGIRARYRNLGGSKKLNNFGTWLNSSYSRNIDPNAYTKLNFNLGGWIQTKSFLDAEIWSVYEPAAKDFYDTRTHGRHINRPNLAVIGLWMGSDNRKRIRITTRLSVYGYKASEWNGKEFGVGLRFRQSDRFSLSFNTDIRKIKKAEGFATFGSNDEIIFGRRDQNIVSNLVGLNYGISNTMSVDMRIRHYWTKIQYQSLHGLSSEGDLIETDFDSDLDLSFNAFTIDLNYIWRFAPGSELRLVWKNNISGVHTDPLTDFTSVKYKEGINRLSSFPQTNSLSISAIYFIDYARDVKKIF